MGNEKIINNDFYGVFFHYVFPTSPFKDKQNLKRLDKTSVRGALLKVGALLATPHWCLDFFPSPELPLCFYTL